MCNCLIVMAISIALPYKVQLWTKPRHGLSRAWVFCETRGGILREAMPTVYVGHEWLVGLQVLDRYNLRNVGM